MNDSGLPPAEHSGTEGHWTITDQRGETTELHGMFLGMGSSNRPYHKHRNSTFAPQGTHCSTCRWTEIRIFKESGPRGRYLIVNRGATIIPGETDRIGFEYVQGAFQVVEKITTRETGTGGTHNAFLTLPASMALAGASDHDDPLREAYVNRAAV